MDLNEVDLALQAAWLLAVDPEGLGGICLRGPAGPARDALLASLRRALLPGTPWRRLPLQIDDEALYGGLDLGLSLAAGRPVARAGLLAEADQGVILLPMAERIEPGLAARLAAALEQGPNGSRFCLVALDEGQSPEEQLPASLLERLALIASPAEGEGALRSNIGSSSLDANAAQGQEPPFDLAAARQRLRELPYDEAIVQALCGTAA
ncbi:MAG: hypothetical protein O9341_10950, partial [Paucibacter sp.]|nr:hypothetical protein [Roseateles sp.]